MTLEEMLASFKSVEVIDKEGAIVDRLRKAAQDQSGKTVIVESDDHLPAIQKAYGTPFIKSVDKRFLPPGEPEALSLLAQKRGIDWKQEYKDRVIAYRASDERPDGHGDIVKQNWLFDEFEKNAPLPFSHKWGELPVGQALDWKVMDWEDPAYKGRMLWLLAFFAGQDTSKFADEVFKLVKSGILKGGSVGFYSTKVVDIKDEKEREKLGLGRFGLILDENHLLEFSPTMIGANSGALALLSTAKKKNLLTADGVKVFRELTRQQSSKDEFLKADRDILSVAKFLLPQSVFEKHEDPERPFYETHETLMYSYPIHGKGDMPPGKEEPKPGAAPKEEPKEESGVEAKVDALMEWATQVTGVFNDIRDLLEQMVGGQKPPAPAKDDEKEPPMKSAFSAEGLAKLLAKVGPPPVGK